MLLVGGDIKFPYEINKFYMSLFSTYVPRILILSKFFF